MNVLIISGFLGAGKTSFIRAMTRATGRQFVVVENEFGDVNVDSRILRNDNAEMKIWELTEGCICCSMNMDFSMSVMTIANTLRPDYLIVEPSGVALLSRVVDGLKKISYENIGILSPVTIVDAAHFRTHRHDYGEYFNDQVKAAGTVVLSKSEGLDAEEFEEAGRELGIARGTDFPLEHYSKWPKERWNALLTRRLADQNAQVGGGVDAGRAVPSRPLSTVTLRGVEFSSPVELIAKFEILLSGAFGRIVRVKGFAPKVCGGEWMLFNAVDGTYGITSAPPAETQDGVEVVVIGEELRTDALGELFEADVCGLDEGEHDGHGHDHD